ncbi:zinc-ribbon domain-containing protein [Lachnospiraceae bacterium C1.1]|nr:zinc ribbon domain-containing protein [Lachnospiraceae bacterium C1.1]
MFCAHCGKELPDGAEFCTSCGKPVIKDDDTEENTSTVSAVSSSESVNNATSGNKKIPKYAIWIAVIVVGFFIFRSYSGGNSSDGGYSKTTQNYDSIAISNAKSILCEDFVDPGSVSWNDEEVVDKDDYERYLVYLDATATTKAGGRNREKYYVILRISGDKYYYKQYGLAWSYANDSDLSYLKSRNQWGEPPENN